MGDLSKALLFHRNCDRERWSVSVSVYGSISPARVVERPYAFPLLPQPLSMRKPLPVTPQTHTHKHTDRQGAYRAAAQTKTNNSCLPPSLMARPLLQVKGYEIFILLINMIIILQPQIHRVGTYFPLHDSWRSFLKENQACSSKSA